MTIQAMGPAQGSPPRRISTRTSKQHGTHYATDTAQIRRTLFSTVIGTVPTVDLATRHEVGAVILHSPLMSGMRVVFRNTNRTWFFDAFPSIDKVSKVKSPVLVIHGTDDEVIDFSHGIGIYKRCPKAV